MVHLSKGCPDGASRRLKDVPKPFYTDYQAMVTHACAALPIPSNVASTAGHLYHVYCTLASSKVPILNKLAMLIANTGAKCFSEQCDAPIVSDMRMARPRARNITLSQLFSLHSVDV